MFASKDATLQVLNCNHAQHQSSKHIFEAFRKREALKKLLKLI